MVRLIGADEGASAFDRLGDARTLYTTGRYAELAALAEDLWVRQSRHDGAEVRGAELTAAGEVQRIAALAHRNDGDVEGAGVALARARTCFAASGSRSGLALTMLVDLYDLVGSHGAGAAALLMLDAIERCVGTGDDRVLPVADALAIINEKRGVVLTGQAAKGEGGVEVLLAAREAHGRALAHAGGDGRRELKGRASIITIDLQRGAIAAKEAAAQLEQLRAAALAAGPIVADVLETVEANLVRLRGGCLALAPYDAW